MSDAMPTISAPNAQTIEKAKITVAENLIGLSEDGKVAIVEQIWSNSSVPSHVEYLLVGTSKFQCLKSKTAKTLYRCVRVDKDGVEFKKSFVI